jgi:methyl-accepting chemotaxis protein
MRMLTEGRSEKYLKKLVGRTDIEDALKRLDKLTQEESRMAAAEILRVTHAVDERVKGVADTAAAIDNRVAGVDERVVGVGEHVADVDERVAGVGDQVAGVVDQVAAVDDQVQRAANDVDEIKSLSSLNLVGVA